MSWLEDPGWVQLRNETLEGLSVDQALVFVTSSLSSKFYIYSLSDACYKCPYVYLDEVDGYSGEPAVLKVDTRFGSKWRLLLDNSQKLNPIDETDQRICEIDTHSFGEFGVYELSITGTEDSVICGLSTLEDPVNIYYPLISCLIALVGLWLVCSWVPEAWRWWKERRRLSRIIIPTSYSYPDSVITQRDDRNGKETQVVKQRLKALDTFRGIAIVLMIFVNGGGGKYWWLEHATWNGLTVADLLFPWFMWIMGVCVPISLKSQLKKNIPRGKIILNVLRRSVILFGLGLILNTSGATKLEEIRTMGVLQRFGIVYFFISTLFVLTTFRDYNKPRFNCVAAFQDFFILIPQWIIVILIGGAHYALSFYLPVPGCPTGYLGPGGYQDNEQYFNCTGGATGYVDRLILGERHIYQHPTSESIYGSPAFDPEGLVGVLNSIVQVFLGVQAGSIVVFHREWHSRVIRWIFWGVLCGVCGGVLCQANQETGWIPVNKNLWSLSFVLITSCFAFFLLSFCLYVIDVKKWWNGSPFYYPGMNSTIMYVGHEICQCFPWHWTYGPMATHGILLAEVIWGTGLWVIIAMWLHSHKFFLSI